MSATWTTEQLNDYIDDRLNAHERAELESAMNDDPSARQAFEELKKIRALVRKAPRFKPRKSVAPGVVQSIGQTALQDTPVSEPVLSLYGRSPTALGNLDFRTAAASIISLAACLLLAVLFVPSPPANDDQLADSTPPGGVVGVETPETVPDIGSVVPGDSTVPPPPDNNRNGGKIAVVPAKDQPSTSPDISDGETGNQPETEVADSGSAAEPVVSKSETRNGFSFNFDEVVLVRANQTNVDSAFRLLALTPIRRTAPPDSFDLPDAGIHSRRGGDVLADKAPQAEEKEDSASPAMSDSPGAGSGDELAPSIMAHYVSVEGTELQLNEFLGQVSAEIDRLAIPVDMFQPSPQSMAADVGAKAAPEENPSAETGISGNHSAPDALVARNLLTGVSSNDSAGDSAETPAETERSLPKHGRKRYLVIFVEGK